MSQRILGIDNGHRGGLVLIDEDSKVLARHVMPIVELDGKGQYDEPALVRILRELTPTLVALEKAQSMPEQSAQSTFSTGFGYGLIRGVLVGLGLRYELVHAKTWQTLLFRDLPKSDTKAQSVLVAGRLWPATDWRANENCRVAHNGLTDAALIAEYARRRLMPASPAYEYGKPLEGTGEDSDEIFRSMGSRA